MSAWAWGISRNLGLEVEVLANEPVDGLIEGQAVGRSLVRSFGPGRDIERPVQGQFQYPGPRRSGSSPGARECLFAPRAGSRSRGRARTRGPRHPAVVSPWPSASPRARPPRQVADPGGIRPRREAGQPPGPSRATASSNRMRMVRSRSISVRLPWLRFPGVFPDFARSPGYSLLYIGWYGGELGGIVRPRAVQ